MSVLQLRRYQKKDADLDAVAASGVAAAWTAYTPTVTAGSGTFTTVSATGRYVVVGKITFVEITITITTNGTAASNVKATLPNTPVSSVYILAGKDQTLSGKLLSGSVIAATSTVNITYYDATYPGASGATLIMSGVYENT